MCHLYCYKGNPFKSILYHKIYCNLKVIVSRQSTLIKSKDTWMHLTPCQFYYLDICFVCDLWHCKEIDAHKATLAM